MLAFKGVSYCTWLIERLGHRTPPPLNTTSFRPWLWPPSGHSDVAQSRAGRSPNSVTGSTSPSRRAKITHWLRVRTADLKDVELRVLLTGASGFVGRETLAALARRDVETIAVSRERPPLLGSVDWRRIDLLDASTLERSLACIRPDIVVHLAWTVEPGLFWTAPANLDWVAATLHLCKAAHRAGARRLVGVGTCNEYAWPLTGNCNENSTASRPSSLYSACKDATRRVLEAFGSSVGLEVAWARPFYLFGVGERTDRLVPYIARALAMGEPALCSSGSVIRDYMDVRDAGEALTALALSNVTGAVNIGSGTGVAVAEIARILGDLAGRPDLVKIGAFPDRDNEPARIVADVSRLRDEVGFGPARGLEAGLRDAFTYWAHREAR